MHRCSDVKLTRISRVHVVSHGVSEGETAVPEGEAQQVVGGEERDSEGEWVTISTSSTSTLSHPCSVLSVRTASHCY